MTRKEIETELRRLGLDKGDIVLLHSSLASFGHVEGGADAVVDAFLAVLGKDGTLVVPIFGELGIITDAVRIRANAVCSVHPIANVAAIGKNADEICKDHWKAETAHAKGTPYMRIADLGGYICLAGVDQDRNTTLHTAEALLRLPYLRAVTRTFQTPEGEVTKTWQHFPGPHRDFIALDRMLRDKSVMRTGHIGNSVIRLMRSRDMIEACLDEGRRNPTFVLCDNPHCADCVAQRAAIRRERFASERFILAASSGLAGRHIHDIAENMAAAGIRNVELDIIAGRPVQMLTTSELERVISELTLLGLRVTTLRASAVGETSEALLNTAAECDVPRVLFPLSSLAKSHAEYAQRLDRDISFYNTCQGSALISEALLDMQEDGASIAFTFSPAAFARSGEKPFLYSFRSKLKRFMDQLDIEDCRFDGTTQPLGQGNAEVKELISILRCASFSGHFVLTSANRQVGSLLDAVKRLEHLLDTM